MASLPMVIRCLPMYDWRPEHVLDRTCSSFFDNSTTVPSTPVRFRNPTAQILGGDWFRPDGCGGGGMPRTLTWPG
jgi:hypothetical protein